MKKSFKVPQINVKVTRLIFETGSVKLKVYLSYFSKCSIKTIMFV